MKEVALRRAWVVLGWATVLVRDQQQRLTHRGHPSVGAMSTSVGWEGNP